MGIVSHPFTPFLPEGARILLLGTFPPVEHRWCMPFYYPNFQNNMWRRFGVKEPKVGDYAATENKGRQIRIYRMPSSSRAYPMKPERKAEQYAKAFHTFPSLLLFNNVNELNFIG